MDALNALNAAINTVNGFLWSKFLIIVLLGLGVYFTIRTGFVQIRCLREMTRCLLEGVGVKSEGKEISSFQAFCISTASRVGVGNIAGVAIAIVLGGPGAIFWMWVVAVIGSATGFVESTLAQIYKIPKEGGAFHGGPAYYIANVLHMPKLAKLFSLLLMVTFSLVYNSLQANTITLSLEASLGWDRAIVGGIISVLIAIIICGGAQVVAKVAERLVPVMAGLYLLITAVVLVLNLDKVPTVFGLILADAFSPQAAVAGGFGAVVMNGIKRGLFSNEAGEGSVPNAAATAKVSHPVKQGLTQAFGVYVDTLIICSASAFLVLVSGQYEIGGKLTGIALVQKCLSSEVGTWAVYFVALMITLFAFSSLVGNYYYGEININVLSEHKAALYFLRAFTVAMVMMGSVAPLPLVWDMADLFMAFLATTNLYAIARLFPRAKVALDDYLTQLRAGKDPVFDPRILPDLEGVHAWGVEDKK
ncbi:MAG: alanine:cation symporter family protein [Succiniclasticum sp.]|jgi:AGCS family alanine or glycine:cation symporter|nr:alanine:cation symporter family protein [Succiniclasticum sp.]MCI6223290.1 alanine:cation symporter family protein [Selenomonadales bacterium]MDY2869533.1 alanine/glycine:cation symporter family protein [Succiniclasticum sp.]MDY6303318.1 alanine/glycine:cation symporter family protein [Succiniclasticum sp.]MDY6345765.1 alanine/glycine:cation symporter family protein [Succiniclasticum sp.]